MLSFVFNIWFNGKLIDKVNHSVGRNQKIKDAVLSVRKSLIEHDGYDPCITVTWPKGQRITVDEWELQGYYYGQWGTLCAGTRTEIRDNKRDYLKNEPLTRLRIVCKRVRL